MTETKMINSKHTNQQTNKKETRPTLYLLIVSIVLVALHQFIVKQVLIASDNQNFELVLGYSKLNFWLLLVLLTISIFIFLTGLNYFSKKVCVILSVLQFIIVFSFVFSAKLYGSIMINFNLISKLCKYIQIPMFIYFWIQLIFVLVFVIYSF